MNTLLKDFKEFDKTNTNSQIVIFGAGTIGRLTDLALKKIGLNAILFVDSDPRKHGKNVQNKNNFS